MLDTPPPATVEHPAASFGADDHVPPASNKSLKTIGVVGVSVLALVLVFGVSSRLMARQDLHATVEAAAIPTVSVVQPQAGETNALVLPGQLQAWADAPVYARTNGYLRRWYVDIGDHVKAGQVLADIDTPEVDQQLLAARAALATADANRALAATTSARWERLVKQKAVSQQEADERAGDLAAKTATENEARANVNRLLALTNFKRIVAPFDGAVTTRATDIGALIVAGDARATPLFTVTDNTRLRLYVNVPQNYASAFKTGTTAHFTTADHPNQVFVAKVERSADAVNVQSGAMLVQLVFDNHAGVLKPGAYAQVTLDGLAGAPVATATAAVPMRIPASALLFRKEGTAVAVVDGSGRVTIRPVQIARDFGAELAIGSGLSSSDRVIDSPSDAIATGDKVKPVLEPKAADAHA
jgi:RND family efflux transporter MFP subunit